MEEVLGYLHKHVADIGFVYISQRQMSAFRHLLDYKRLEYQVLLKTEPKLFVGPKHPLYHAEAISASSIRELKFVQSREEFFSIHAHLGHIKDDFQKYQPGQQIVETNSDHLMMHLLMETDLCNIGSSLLQGKFEKYAIHSIPITEIKDTISFGYVKRRRSGLSETAREFIQYLKDVFVNHE